MTDFSHLDALQSRLLNERARLNKATTRKEREMRAAWVMQCEKEIESEYKFLGITPMTDDELLAELLA
jgi:hypothetical protein